MSFPALERPLRAADNICRENLREDEVIANQTVECERCNSQREIASEIACQTETYVVFQPIPEPGIST
jgi:hypothetical protein